MSNNLLRALPDKLGQLRHLRSLDCSHNQLQVLPPSLADCAKLADLNAAGNPLMCPAADVVSRGAAATRAFLLDVQRNQHRVSRCVRVVLLGDPQSGRTSLARALTSHRIGQRWRTPAAVAAAAATTGVTIQEAQFDPVQRERSESTDEQQQQQTEATATSTTTTTTTITTTTTTSTTSVDAGLSTRVDDEATADDVATGRGTRFFVWDFAPDFYTQLHATLCSEQQLTVVTWRLRDTRIGATPLVWLTSLAQALATKKARGETMQKIPNEGVSVVLVGTHADDPSLTPELAQAHLEFVADELQRMPELAGRIDVKCILSCSTTDGTGVEELQRTLLQLAPSVRLWHTEVSASWRALEAALCDSSHRRMPIISVAAAERVAALCGVEREDVGRCLRYLHALGRVLFFDTPRGKLNSRLMLDPLYLYSVAHHVGATASKLSSSSTSLLKASSSQILSVDEPAPPSLRPRPSTVDLASMRYGGAELSQSRLDADLRRYAEASRPWLVSLLQHVNLLLPLPRAASPAADAPSALFAPALTRNMPTASLWPQSLGEDDKQIELRRIHTLEFASDAVLLRFLQRLLHCEELQVAWTWSRGVLFSFRDVLFYVELSWDKRTLQQSARWTPVAGSEPAPTEDRKCRRCAKQVGEDGVQALDGFFCAGCFQCAACSKAIAGDFLLSNEQPFCSQACYRSKYSSSELPATPRGAGDAKTPRGDAAPVPAVVSEAAQYEARRANLEKEIKLAQERRAGIVEQLAAAAGRVKASSSRRNTDVRLAKLLASMKQDLVECEAELAVLDRQLRTLPQASAAIAVPKTESDTPRSGDDDSSHSPTVSLRVRPPSRFTSTRSDDGDESGGSGGGGADALRRFSSSRRDLQRQASRRVPLADADGASDRLSERRRASQAFSDAVARLSRRVTPARQSRHALAVPVAVVEGMRLVDELLGECFEDVDSDAVCAVCCTMCLRHGAAKVHRFSFADALAALLQHGPSSWLTCSNGHSVHISELVPDYCLSDIDAAVPLLADQSAVIVDGKRDEIGRGAFGAIFRSVVRDGVRGTANGTAVAIKELIVAPDASAAERVQVLLEFRTELLAMQRAGRSECLVGALAFAMSPSLALFMELAVGGTLHGALHTASLELPWVARTRIALDVARGLAHMHRSKPALLHRDLKSPNVLLTQVGAGIAAHAAGSAPLAKIADFGTCCAYRGVALTRRVVDQPRWLAPEVMQMAGYGLASDVYALGITLWEVATRDEPWDEFQYGAFTSQLERDCIAGRRPSLPSDATVPAAFSAIVRACWAPAIAHRPTAAGACALLEAFVAGKSAPPALVDDEDWSRDALLRCQLHATPFVQLTFASLRAVVAWMGDIETGTSDERDAVFRALCRTRPDVQSRCELLAVLTQWARSVPIDFVDAWVMVERRELERRRSALTHWLAIWATACPEHFARESDVDFHRAVRAAVDAVSSGVAAEQKLSPDAAKDVDALQEALAAARATPRRAVVVAPRLASKTIKSLWLVSMPVADLATELTLLEHGFMQNVDVDALQAWRAEHSALAGAYGDSSPRAGDDARGAHAIVAWLEWSRRAVDWVATEVLAPEQVQGRADAIAKFVQVALHCANELRNFNTAFQIVAALQQPTVTSLKRTWAALPPKVRADLDGLVTLLTPAGGGKLYREALAVRGSSNTRVPQLNVLLSDLCEMRDLLDHPTEWHNDNNTGRRGGGGGPSESSSTSMAPTPRDVAESPRRSTESHRKRHKDGGSSKRRHKRKGGSRHQPADADAAVAATLAPPKLPDDESSSDDEPERALAASSQRLQRPTTPTLNSSSTVRRLTRTDVEALVDVGTTTRLAALLRSFIDWSTAAYGFASRPDVRMLLLAVEVWPHDTLDEIARLREPDSAAPSSTGDGHDAVGEAHANLPAALRGDMARLRCMLRCYASVVMSALALPTTVLLANGAFHWRLVRGRVPLMCLLNAGALERRRGNDVLSSHSQQDAVPLLGAELVAGLNMLATPVATSNATMLQEVQLSVLSACLAADAGLERAFYHSIAEKWALRLRALTAGDAVGVASTPEPSASALAQAVKDGIAAEAAAFAALTAAQSESATSSSAGSAVALNSSSSAVSERPPAPSGTQPVALGGVRDKLRSLGTILRRKVAERESGAGGGGGGGGGGSESFSISAPSTFKKVEMTIDDLRTAAVTTVPLNDDVRSRVVDGATNELAEHFEDEVHHDEVVIRAYKCRNAQKRKGTLFITPLAIYFYSKSMTQTVRRRLSLFDTAIAVTAPPVSATTGAEVALLGERFAFANPALRDEAFALMRKLSLPGALAQDAPAPASSSESSTPLSASGTTPNVPLPTSMSSKLLAVRDAVLQASAVSAGTLPAQPAAPAAPVVTAAQWRAKAIRKLRRERRAAELELPLRKCLAQGDAVGASLVSSDEWESLLRGSRTLQLVAGACVAKEGDTSGRIYVLKTGRVRLERGAGGEARVVGFVCAGETFGVGGWLLSCAALETALVESPAAEVHVLTVSYVEKLLLLQPATAAHFMQLVALNLLARLRAYELALSVPPGGRAAQLAALSDRRDGGGVVPPALSAAHEALAGDFGGEVSESDDTESSTPDSSEAMIGLLAEDGGAGGDDESDSTSDAALDELLKSRRRRRKKSGAAATSPAAGSTASAATAADEKEKRRKHRKHRSKK